MKNKIILSLVTIIFLSSCANKFSLTKRKYTKGYYFASSKNNNSSKKENENNNLTVKNLSSKKTELAQTTTTAELKNTEPIEIAKTEMPVLKTNKIKQATKTVHDLIASNHNKTVYNSPTVRSLPSSEKPLQQATKSDSDVKLIVMIILCFFPFINLIPVYLHDGKVLTLNFLITLLLDFTFILGIVFALLVVLDVIDLK